MTLRIATWNINGLRSGIGRGMQAWLEQSANDIVCLQEVKAQEDLLGESWFTGYMAYWADATRPGYSGVVTLVAPNLQPLSVTKGIGNAAIDAEGRVLTVEFDRFTLVNVYAPHSHRLLRRLDFKMEFLSRFLDFLEGRKRSGKPLIIVGDLNVALEEDDVTNFKANRKNAGFLPQEREWLASLLRSGFSDAFRAFHAGPGHYTWWSPIKGVKDRNIGWRLDYILVDERLSERLVTCFHSPERHESDHCPVTAVFDLDEAAKL